MILQLMLEKFQVLDLTEQEKMLMKVEVYQLRGWVTKVQILNLAHLIQCGELL